MTTVCWRDCTNQCVLTNLWFLLLANDSTIDHVKTWKVYSVNIMQCGGCSNLVILGHIWINWFPNTLVERSLVTQDSMEGLTSSVLQEIVKHLFKKVITQSFVQVGMEHASSVSPNAVGSDKWQSWFWCLKHFINYWVVNRYWPLKKPMIREHLQLTKLSVLLGTDKTELSLNVQISTDLSAWPKCWSFINPQQNGSNILFSNAFTWRIKQKVEIPFWLWTHGC